MIRTRHLALLAAIVALAAFAAQASAQTPLLQLDYNSAKIFGTVEIAGGAIDLTNGAMIVTTSSFGFVPTGGAVNEYGEPGVAEYGDAAIHDALAEGVNYNGGFWNGTNGIMSSDAENNAGTNTTIGWIDNSLGIYSSFRGVPLTTSESIIAYTYYGDADLNGVVDSADYGLWSAGLGQPVGLYGQTGSIVNIWNGTSLVPTPEPPEWIDGDFDQSGSVDSADYGLWSANYQLPPLYTAGQIQPAAASAVPEPATFVLLAAFALSGFGVRFARKFHF